MIDEKTKTALSNTLQSDFGKSSRLSMSDYVKAKTINYTEKGVIVEFLLITLVGGVDPFHPTEAIAKFKEASAEKLKLVFDSLPKQYEEQAKLFQGAARGIKVKPDKDSVDSRIEYVGMGNFGEVIRKAIFKTFITAEITITK